MKQTLWLVGLVAGLLALYFVTRPRPVVLYAQSLPTTVHLTWAPNPTSDNVTGYVIVVDGNAPQTVRPTDVCTASACTAPITLTAYGDHQATVAAQNLKLSTDPTSTQTGPPSAPAQATLSAPPGQTQGAAFKP